MMSFSFPPAFPPSTIKNLQPGRSISGRLSWILSMARGLGVRRTGSLRVRLHYRSPSCEFDNGFLRLRSIIKNRFVTHAAARPFYPLLLQMARIAAQEPFDRGEHKTQAPQYSCHRRADTLDEQPGQPDQEDGQSP